MILVVDNDQTTLDQALEILNRNRQVFLASSAARGLELAQQLGFSVALIDLDLPGADGFDLIKQLRKEHPHISIIVISSAAHSFTIDDAKRIGAVEVLEKPITPRWKPVVERVRAEHLRC